MRLIDADALREIWVCQPGHDFEPSSFVYSIDNAPTVEPASRWHRVEDNPPDEKTDAIFYYKWTGINGIRRKEISIISLGALIALECRPIAWMEKPKPPKEE